MKWNDADCHIELETGGDDDCDDCTPFKGEFV